MVDGEKRCPNCHRAIDEDIESAARLRGFPLFNHAKGNTEATETLMRKAYKALAGREWDSA